MTDETEENGKDTKLGGTKPMDTKTVNENCRYRFNQWKQRRKLRNQVFYTLFFYTVCAYPGTQIC